MQKNKISTKLMCVVAMLIAITVVLGYVSGFLRVGNISKISVSFISVYISAVMYGPLTGGFVGAVADFISYIVNPTGVYLWQLTLIEFVYGVLFGVLFYKKNNRGYLSLNIRIAIFSLIQLAFNLFAKTYVLMSVGYLPSAFFEGVVLRLPSCIFAVVLNFAVINLLQRFIPILTKNR